jgi:hypothetical protein
MAGFMAEELSHRLNWMRDEQTRTNASVETRLKELEADNKEIRNRLTVLTRLLISRQIATAEEIATALTAISTPAEPSETANDS